MASDWRASKGRISFAGCVDLVSDMGTDDMVVVLNSGVVMDWEVLKGGNEYVERLSKGVRASQMVNCSRHSFPTLPLPPSVRAS